MNRRNHPRPHPKQILAIGALACVLLGAGGGLYIKSHVFEPVAPSPPGQERSADDVFLDGFRGPLLTEADIRPGAIKRLIEQDVEMTFAERRYELAAAFPQLGQRDLLILATVLRVHGSFSTYVLRNTVPQEIGPLLVSHAGNCSDHAIRLAMALEAIGIRPAIVSVVSPSLPGHVFVDAYDPVGKAAYLLDSNTNVFIKVADSNIEKSGLLLLHGMTVDQRARVMDSNSIFLPVSFKYLDPGPSSVIPGREFSLADINAVLTKRDALWRKALVDEIDEIFSWWSAKGAFPAHAPRTLEYWAEVLGNPGIAEFQPGNGLNVGALWRAANLDTSTIPSSVESVAGPPVYTD